MGQQKAKGVVTISNADGRIRLRWRYQKQRYSLSLFEFTKANLVQARTVALQIEQDLLTENFYVSLDRYKPTTSQANRRQESKTLEEQFEEWVWNYRNMDCDRDIDYQSTRSMLRRWGKFDETTVVRCFAGEAIGAGTYNRRLTLLKSFFSMDQEKWYHPRKPLGRCPAPEKQKDGKSQPEAVFRRGDRKGSRGL